MVNRFVRLGGKQKTVMDRRECASQSYSTAKSGTAFSSLFTRALFGIYIIFERTRTVRKRIHGGYASPL